MGERVREYGLREHLCERDNEKMTSAAMEMRQGMTGWIDTGEERVVWVT